MFKYQADVHEIMLDAKNVILRFLAPSESFYGALCPLFGRRIFFFSCYGGAYCKFVLVFYIFLLDGSNMRARKDSASFPWYPGGHFQINAWNESEYELCL